MNGVNKQVIQTGWGSGTPWWADTQIQVNDGGVFAWYSNFTWDKISSLILWDWVGESITIKWRDASTPTAWGTSIYIQGWHDLDDPDWLEWYGWDVLVSSWNWITYAWRFQMSWGNSQYWEGWWFDLRGWLWPIGWQMNFRPWIWTWVTDWVDNAVIDNAWTWYSVGSIFYINGWTEDCYFKVTEVDVWWEILELDRLTWWQGYSIWVWLATTTISWGWSGATMEITSLISWGNGKFTIEHPTSWFKAELNVDALTANQTYTLQDWSWTLAFLSQIGKDEFWLTVDWAGAVVTTGSKWFRYMWYDGTITGWNVTSDVSWSIVFDIKRSGVSIAGTEKPTLSSQSSNSDLTLTTWTTAITAWDELEFIVDSASTVTRATLTILITKS